MMAARASIEGAKPLSVAATPSLVADHTKGFASGGRMSAFARLAPAGRF